jgi:hypothetical protein
LSVWLILKSPVWTTMPRGVRMASPTPSTTLWLTRMNSTSKGPRFSGAHAALHLVQGLAVASSSFFQLVAHDAQGEGGAENRDIDLLSR